MPDSNRVFARVVAIVFAMSLLLAPLVWRLAVQAQTGSQADTPTINRRKHGIEGGWSPRAGSNWNGRAI